jgi:D-serine deaminase-like pyridoxal phosphate-dependent protein
MIDDEGGLQDARRFIGGPVERVPTPALIVDLPAVERNIAEMARRMAGLPAALRPHAKIHKSAAFGRLQLQAGAAGLTTATVWEAGLMVDGGITDVLVANEVVDRVKADHLASLAGRAQITTLVDSPEGVTQLAAAAGRSGTVIDVLVDVDVGFLRCGVRGADSAVGLGTLVDDSRGVRLRGVFGYEGHCMLEPDRDTRVAKTTAANQALLDAADAFHRAGLSTEVIASGGFGTWDITGANPRITEIHAGSYIFYDAFHRNLVPGFEPALTVSATVISSSDEGAVIDCGRKSIGIDRAAPELLDSPAGVQYLHGEYSVHEEHTILTQPPEGRLAVGGTVRVVPGYSPTTVNLYDVYFVAADDQVVDVWPIAGRYGRTTVGADDVRTS